MRSQRMKTFLILLLAASAFGQTTTITGVIKDLTVTPVTSGKVVFTLKPSVDTTISGNARFTPGAPITCYIQPDGTLKNAAQLAACIVATNTSLTPAGTSYRVDICPVFSCASSFNFYAINSSYDISTIVPTPTTGPVQNFADVFSNQSIAGNKTFTGITNLSGVASCNENGAFVVGSPCYATIQAAITGAGSSGSVLIPATYLGADTYTNPSSIPVLDLRNGAVGISAILSVFSHVRPIQPAPGSETQYPLGHDLSLESAGPADIHIVNTKKATTSSAMGACPGSGITIVVGTTVGFAPPISGMFISVGRGTSTFENITSYTIADPTHFVITCVNAHAGSVDIEQVGSLFVDTGSNWILSGANNPSQNTQIQHQILDLHHNIILALPVDTTAAFPLNTVGIGQIITGSSGNPGLIRFWSQGGATAGDADMNVDINAGNGGALRGAQLNLKQNNVTKWSVLNDTSNSFDISDPSVINRIQLIHNDRTSIESGSGGSIKLNDLANSGQGVLFFSGGATPSQVASVDLNGKGIFNGGMQIGSSGILSTIRQHKRISTGSIGGTTRSEVLLTWANTFTDTSYTVECTVEDATTAAASQGLTLERIRTKSATQVGAVINNPTGGPLTGTLDCSADHD